jgi:hypothetical protein
MRIIGLTILLFTLLSSCDTDEKQLTYNDFEASLDPEMDYTAIVRKFGEPQKDIGSGIHIYVYELNDSTQIIIGYTDQILYARHVDKDHNVLHTLI